jgi:hypothetical protein
MGDTHLDTQSRYAPSDHLHHDSGRTEVMFLAARDNEIVNE